MRAEHPNQSHTAILSCLRRSVLSGEDAEGTAAGRTEAVRPDGRPLRAKASLHRQRWERSGIEDDAVSPAPNRSTTNAVVGALRALPLEWGAENAVVSAWGKSFPQPKGGLNYVCSVSTATY